MSRDRKNSNIRNVRLVLKAAALMISILSFSYLIARDVKKDLLDSIKAVEAGLKDDIEEVKRDLDRLENRE